MPLLCVNLRWSYNLPFLYSRRMITAHSYWRGHQVGLFPFRSTFYFGTFVVISKHYDPYQNLHVWQRIHNPGSWQGHSTLYQIRMQCNVDEISASAYSFYWHFCLLWSGNTFQNLERDALSFLVSWLFELLCAQSNLYSRQHVSGDMYSNTLACRWAVLNRCSHPLEVLPLPIWLWPMALQVAVQQCCPEH